MSRKSEPSLSTRFVSATGTSLLLPFYDPLVTIFTRELACKKHLIEQASLQCAQRVLDVGCGSGTLGKLAFESEPEIQFVGVDIDARMLNQARKKLIRTNATFIETSATDLRCADESFDLVTSSLLFHHLTPNEKLGALAEIARVLVPGGRLLLADYCRPASRWDHLRFMPVRLVDGFSRTRCNLRGQLPILIAESGLTSVRITNELSTALGTLRCYEAIKVK